MKIIIDTEKDIIEVLPTNFTPSELRFLTQTNTQLNVYLIIPT